MLVAVAGIAGHKSKRDLLAVVRCRNLEAHVLFRHQRIDRLQPSLRPAHLADVADSPKLPQRFLPGFNARCQYGSIIRFGGAPACAETIEKERWLITCEFGPEDAKIFRVQSAFLGDGVKGLAFG